MQYKVIIVARAGRGAETLYGAQAGDDCMSTITCDYLLAIVYH